MTINESLGNPLFFAYKNAGPTIALALPAILLNSIAFSGVFMNAFVIFTTICTKSLHGTANFLLSLICFCEILHQSGHCIFLFVALSGINFIDSAMATLLELPMYFGSNVALFGMMLAAIDRLFAVISPAKHKKIGRAIYLTFLTILCIIYGIYWDIYMFNFYCINNPSIPVTGLVSDLLVSEPGIKFFYETATLNGIAILCYLLVWIIIKRKSGVTKETNTRLMKSLAIIIVINIGGYLVSLSFYQLLYIFMEIMDYKMIWHLGILLPGLSLNFGAACNAPVLYMTSTEYRKAFLRYLKKLADIFRIKNFKKHENIATFNVRFNATQTFANANGRSEIQRISTSSIGIHHLQQPITISRSFS